MAARRSNADHVIRHRCFRLCTYRPIMGTSDWFGTSSFRILEVAQKINNGPADDGPSICLTNADMIYAICERVKYSISDNLLIQKTNFVIPRALCWGCLFHQHPCASGGWGGWWGGGLKTSRPDSTVELQKRYPSVSPQCRNLGI